MSCAAFTFFGIYVAASNKNNTWIVAGSAVLAAAMLFVAFFRTWKRQYDERTEFEAELNKQADIQGTITVISAPFSPYGDRQPPTEIRIAFDCVNFGKRSCEISKFDSILPESPFLKVHTCSLRPPKRVGSEQALRFDMSYLINDIPPEQMACMSLRVVLIDSVGTRYEQPKTTFVPSVNQFPKT